MAALIVAATENLTALYIDPRYVLLAPVLILLDHPHRPAVGPVWHGRRIQGGYDGAADRAAHSVVTADQHRAHACVASRAGAVAVGRSGGRGAFRPAALLPIFWIHLVNGCLIAIIGAVALNLLTGNARLVSLGQAAFIGIGAFAAGLLHRAYGLNIVLALAAAAAAGAISGTLIALLSLRLRALYVAVTTLVLHFAVVTVFSLVQAVFLDSSGIILPHPGDILV